MNMMRLTLCQMNRGRKISFCRFGSVSKFKCNITYNKMDSVVFSDEVYMFLRRNKISEEVIAELYNYVKEEEYDTDTICLDMDHVGNIANHMEDDKCISSIKQLIPICKGVASVPYLSRRLLFTCMIFRFICLLIDQFKVFNTIKSFVTNFISSNLTCII